MNNPVEIINSLYQTYYKNNLTPEEIVSSHWKQMHKQARVDIVDNKVKAVHGVGFGDLQCASLPQKIFSWITIISYLFNLDNRRELISKINIARSLAKRMKLFFSYDCFRQLCTVILLTKHIPLDKKIRVVNVGDGYGFLSALIKEIFPKAELVLVDLGKTLLFQANFCFSAHTNKKHFLVSENIIEHDFSADFIYCPAEKLDMLNNLSFDLAINIASMQEMNEQTVENYFSFLRQQMVEDNLFYCCNREEKIMPEGEISRILKYPWVEDDKFLVDDMCPWHKHFFAFHKTEKGPKIFDCRLPFINYFDGEHRHRLAMLQTVKN